MGWQIVLHAEGTSSALSSSASEKGRMVAKPARRKVNLMMIGEERICEAIKARVRLMIKGADDDENRYSNCRRVCRFNTQDTASQSIPRKQNKLLIDIIYHEEYLVT